MNHHRTANGTTIIEARRVSPGGGTGGDFTYAVEIERKAAAPAADTGDRRRAPRQRTRLRSGKIVDAGGRFVTECLLHDLSPRGGRIRLPAAMDLARTIQLFDDQTGVLRPAVVLWRRDRDLGIAFLPSVADARNRAVAAEMRGKYYAVRN